MKLIFTSICLLAVTSFSYSQINPGTLGNAGKSIIGGINDKKKAKNIQNAIVETEINNRPVSILRVPEDKIISNAKAYITRVQNSLNSYRQKYNNGEHVDATNFNEHLDDIRITDADWPVSYYQTEMDEYRQYETQLVRKEKIRQDSLDAVARVNKKREADSLQNQKAKLNDSLAYVERTRDFQFINKEFVLLKEKPSDASQTMGRIYLGSYVRVAGYSESTGYVKISLQGVAGFVKKSELSSTLEALAVAEPELRLFKSRQYYKYEPNYDYEVSTQSLYTETETTTQSSGARTSRSSSSRSNTSRPATTRTYYTGPRGGCYYINGSGNKVYVDKGYCK